jgi:hypothetical protein
MVINAVGGRGNTYDAGRLVEPLPQLCLAPATSRVPVFVTALKWTALISLLSGTVMGQAQGFSKDACAAQNAEVDKFAQWVSTSTPKTLPFNQAKLNAANAALRYCRVVPMDEAEFIRDISTARSASSQAQNDMQRGGIKAERDVAICRAIGSLRISNWIGTVKTVDSNSDGKGVLGIYLGENITITTWSNDFSDRDDRTLIEPSTDVFRAAEILKPGQAVSFSGSFIPHSGDCIEESSLTLSGKLGDPDFIFRFSGIGPYSGPSQSISEKPRPTISESPYSQGQENSQHEPGAGDYYVKSASSPASELRSSTTISGQCLSYGGDSKRGPVTVKLNGTIEERTFPGRPNYSSVANGDEPEQEWVLDLYAPICTLRGDADMPPEDNATKLQLTFNRKEDYEKYRDQLGKLVIVTGGLGFGFNGHYHTKVSLNVLDIEPSDQAHQGVNTTAR